MIFFTVYRIELNLCSFSGLLGGHSMAVMLKESGQMLWYQDELLHMAKDLGLRLLPAFNTSSGLPYPRVSDHTRIHKHMTDVYWYKNMSSIINRFF